MTEFKPNPYQLQLSNHKGSATIVWLPIEEARLTYELIVSGPTMKETCPLNDLSKLIKEIVDSAEISTGKYNPNSWLIFVSKPMKMSEKALILATVLNETLFAELSEIPITR